MGRSWWKVFRGALIFIGFYLTGAVFGLLFFRLYSLTTRDPVERFRRNQVSIRRGVRFTIDLLRWARLFEFDARKVDPQLPDRPAIIIANHPTTIDVVAVLAVYSEAVVVVKRKIWNDPFLRHLFRWCGHIDGGDGSMESNRALLAAVETRLKQGFSVIIFPEGTRSPPYGIGRMYKGAFTLAASTQTDILPVLITADPPALIKEVPWYVLPDKPVDYRVRPLPIISAQGATAVALHRQTVAMYRKALGLSPEERAEPVRTEGEHAA